MKDFSLDDIDIIWNQNKSNLKSIGANYVKRKYK